MNEPADTMVLDYGRLLRRYGLLALLLAIVGAVAGVISLGLIPPAYDAKALLEIQPRNALPQALQADVRIGNTDLLTEAEVIVSHTILQRVLQRLQFETLPPAPPTSDLGARLRRILGTDTNEFVPAALGVDDVDGLDAERLPRPMAMALRTVTARAIVNTHLIEVTCRSTDPQFAAEFVNVLADEYTQQNYQTRADTMRVSTQWISEKLKETKNKLIDSEKRLEDFSRESGNLFAKREGTLAEAKLEELQSRISTAESDLVPKQVRYEMIQRTPPAALPEVLKDPDLDSYEPRITELRRQESALLTTLQPGHPKVRKIEAEIGEMQAAFQNQIKSTVERTTSEYQAALRERDLLRKDYAAAARQVAGQSDKQSQFDALKRERESARLAYDSLLHSADEAGLVASAPLHNIQTVDRAVPARQPVSPKPLINVGAGAAAGLAMCFGIAFLIEARDRRLTSPHQASHYLTVPTLGVIPSVKEVTGFRERFMPYLAGQPAEEPEVTNALTLHHRNSDSQGFLSPRLQLAESFRVTLASLLGQSQESRHLKIILITSPGPREGKTTVASNLGVALAETGRRVLLIDADFRRPRAHLVFGLENRNGLVDLLEDDAPVASYRPDQIGMRTSVRNLSILPNGRRAGNIAQQLYSPRLTELVQRLKNDFDFVLIDAPPILPVADARILSGLSDGVVLVLRSAVTDRESATEALSRLQDDRTVILGTVLNDWKPTRAQAAKYYYYTPQEDRDEASRASQKS